MIKFYLPSIYLTGRRAQCIERFGMTDASTITATLDEGFTLLLNVVVGLISGVAGAEVYRRATFGRSKKTDIEICDYVIKRFKSNGVPALQVKIKNNSPKDLADVEVKIFGIEYYDSEKYHQNRTLLAEKHLDFLPAYDAKDKKCIFFYVPSLYSHSFNIHEKIDAFTDILILVRATDYYDNNIVIKEKIIEKSKIKDNHWNYETCKCTTTKRSDIRTPRKIHLPVESALEQCPFIKTRME